MSALSEDVELWGPGPAHDLFFAFLQGADASLGPSVHESQGKAVFVSGNFGFV